MDRSARRPLMCMYGDDEGWDLFRSEKRRAAKEHRCGECRRTVAKGERYRYDTGLYDGTWQSMKTCLHCDQAVRWLDVACGGYVYDAVEQDLGEHVVGDERYLRTAPLTRLYRWMRTDWKDRGGNLRPVEDVKAVADKAIAAYKAQYTKAVA